MKASRWKIACINWSHPDAPHASAYILDPRGSMIASWYFPTWHEAVEFVARCLRRAAIVAPIKPCCPGAGTAAHVRGCVHQPEAGR